MQLTPPAAPAIRRPRHRPGQSQHRSGVPAA